MTDAQREQNRRELIDEIKRAVRKEFPDLIAATMTALREELRHELLVTGLCHAPWHVQDGQERAALAMRLRATADLLDPLEESYDWLDDPVEEKREAS